MQIRYIDGKTESQKVDNMDHAIDILHDKLPDVWLGDQEEIDGLLRIPVWIDEQSSIDDDGEKAVAYIEEAA